MKNKSVAILLCVFCAAYVHAQQSLVGKYSGSAAIMAKTGSATNIGVNVEITSADNGRLQGSAIIFGKRCPSAYAIEGTVDGGNLKFNMVGGNENLGCGVARFEVVAEGDKLAGKMSYDGAMRDVKLSK